MNIQSDFRAAEPNPQPVPHFVLPNGVRVNYLHRPMQVVSFFNLRLHVGGGVPLNDASIKGEEPGIAHFYEHCFRGGFGDEGPERVERFFLLADTRLRDPALTNLDRTENTITVIHGKEERFFKYLAAMMLTPALREVDIHRECHRIIEEIRKEKPNDRVKRAVLWSTFPQDSAATASVSGTEKDVMSIDLESLRAYQDRYIVGRNIEVNYAGPLTQDQVRQIVTESACGSIKIGEPARRISLAFKDSISAHALIENEQPEFHLMFLLPGSHGARFEQNRLLRDYASNLRVYLDTWMTIKGHNHNGTQQQTTSYGSWAHCTFGLEQNRISCGFGASDIHSLLGHFLTGVARFSEHLSGLDLEQVNEALIVEEGKFGKSAPKSQFNFMTQMSGMFGQTYDPEMVADNNIRPPNHCDFLHLHQQVMRAPINVFSSGPVDYSLDRLSIPVIRGQLDAAISKSVPMMAQGLGSNP
jgi:hypothetical protein